MFIARIASSAWLHYPVIFLACYGASGAAALIYQVIWVRLFALALGHTVASSSIVLAAFMCGLALGAAIAGRLKPAPEASLARYATLEILVAVAAIALPAALSSLEPALAWAYADGTASGRFTIVRAAISFVLVGIPAAAMGATFPAGGVMVRCANASRPVSRERSPYRRGKPVCDQHNRRRCRCDRRWILADSRLRSSRNHMDCRRFECWRGRWCDCGFSAHIAGRLRFQCVLSRRNARAPKRSDAAGHGRSLRLQPPPSPDLPPSCSKSAGHDSSR